MSDLDSPTTDLMDRNAEIEASMMNQVSSLEEENRILKKQLSEKDSKVSQLGQLTEVQKAQVQDMKEQLFALQNDIEEQEFDRQTQITDFTDKEKETAAELEQLKDTISSLETKLMESNSSNRKLELELEEVKFNSSYETDQKETLETSIKNLRFQRSESQQENSSLKKELESLNDETRQLLGKIYSLEAENENLQSSVKSLRDKNVELMAEIEILKEEASKRVVFSNDMLKDTIDGKALEIVHVPKEEDSVLSNSFSEDRSALQRRVQELGDTNVGLEKELKKVQNRLRDADSKLSNSQNKSVDVLQTWKQLEDLRKEHDETVQRLQESQIINTDMEMESRRLAKENVLAQAALRNELKNAKQESEKETQALIEKHRSEIKSLEEKILELGNSQNFFDDTHLTLSEHKEIVIALETSILDLQNKLSVAEENKSTAKSAPALDRKKDDKFGELMRASEQDSKKIKWLEAEISQLSIRSELETSEILEKKQKIICDLEQRNQELDNKVIELQNSMEHLRVELAKNEVESKRHSEERSILTQEYKRTVGELESRIEQKDEEIRLLKLKIEELSDSVETIRADFSQSKTTHSRNTEDFNEQLIAKDKSLTELESKIKENEMVIYGLKESTDEYKTKFDRARVEIKDLRRQIEDQQSTIDDLEFRTKQDGYRSGHFEQSAESSRKQNETLKLEIQECKSRMISLSTDLANVNHLESELRSKTSAQEIEIESLKEALEKREILIEKMQSSLMSLKGSDIQEENKEHDKNESIILEIKREADKNLELLKKQLIDLEKSKDLAMADLDSKLHDRETTIAALVKASVTLEGKITSIQSENARLKMQTHSELPQESDELIKLRNNNETLHQEIISLKAKIGNTEFGRDQRHIQYTSIERPIMTDADSISTVSWKREKEVLLDESKTKLREKDITIASLKQMSLKQRETIMTLEEEINDLHEEKLVAKEAGDPEEFERLQKESEIFAAQVIEQEEEIGKLKQLLRKSEVKNRLLKSSASPKAGNLEKENAELRKKLQTIESDRTEKYRLLQAKEGEIYQLKEKLRQNGADDHHVQSLQDELDQLKVYVDECEKRMSESSQYYLATIEDLEDQIDASAKNPSSTNRNLINQYKNDLMEKERLIAALERNSNLQSKKIASLLEELDELRRSIGKRSRQLTGRDLKHNDNLIKELETERATNIAQARQVAALKREISQLQDDVATQARDNMGTNKTQLLNDIEKEKKANADLSNQVSDLRGKVQHLSRKEQELYRELEIKTKMTNTLESQVASLEVNIRELENSVSKDTSQVERDLENEKAANTALTKGLSELRERAAYLENKLDEMTTAEERNKAIHDQLTKDVEAERSEKQKLYDELEKSKDRISDLEMGARKILELQSHLGDKDLFDGTIHDQFDKMISSLQLEKDSEIDSLRKELIDARQSKTGVEIELKTKLDESENALQNVKEDFEIKMKKKNGKIAALQETMESQEQTMSYMRAEMDQLQRNMEKVALERRADSE